MGKKNKWLLVEEGYGVAYVGTSKEIKDKFGISIARMSSAVANNMHVTAFGYYYFSVYKLDYRYNFYDKKGNLVAEEKKYAFNEEENETGYSKHELTKMLDGKYVEGLRAVEVLVPEGTVPIPKELFSVSKEGLTEFIKLEEWELNDD